MMVRDDQMWIKKMVSYFLRWFAAWACLLDSVVSVMTLGTVWPSFGFSAIVYQVKYQLDIKIEEKKSEKKPILRNLFKIGVDKSLFPIYVKFGLSILKLVDAVVQIVSLGFLYSTFEMSARLWIIVNRDDYFKTNVGK